jgi:lipopolysaccharide transport system ATP-binding protein
VSTAVIQVEGLGKRYRRGLQASRGMLRDTLTNFVRSPLGALRRPNHETFWALEDVSLQVHEGEVLGLIGRNGAGKTTLLKILSRITRPTTGWAQIHGRVRSLLEVGTGFHGELSGRENAYLSGSILGMPKREIDRKFDEIVAFADIEKFIDTPVKHYSSGMYVRLAFAVAAHLEPEILLVDEVLAVGDLNFQKKCLGKMGDVARHGRTVVLVSHQLNQIRRLCHRVVWVDGGHVRMNGAAQEVVSSYESAMAQGDRERSGQDRGGTRGVRFLAWELVVPDGHDPYTVETLGPVTVQFAVRIDRQVDGGHHGIALFDNDGRLIWGNALDALQLGPGDYEFRHAFPFLPLRPGAYTWRVSLYEGGECIDDLDCVPQMIVGTEPLGHPRDEWSGLLNVPSNFQAMQKSVNEVST